jgi:hypothetical protein
MFKADRITTNVERRNVLRLGTVIVAGEPIPPARTFNLPGPTQMAEFEKLAVPFSKQSLFFRRRLS